MFPTHGFNHGKYDVPMVETMGWHETIKERICRKKKIKTVKTVVTLDWECNAIYNLVMVLTIFIVMKYVI
ncbi:hypothetical protein [Cytophaga hutchinsonii]|uniref:Uncharacterized protein n=1 Tax=Cytophaga hutchinsonii (strain ATCC 33406 / DSM 1761 / CIP 103989 / NBRC 15051 / NCIMB 9469 / D465) TaxID=269798 RepID=A0A6N4ST66_CYTH3|nr:hypothetical protein [Cytophaga hutchinsonii]ABG59610.1 hypothetical protein CHU_2352 [Cytophaga hutchinsonii ATCC 33406]SFX67282.1 hypothetical protein SAMN04487930_107180 [Cytophaga hutchinsonii ATCC 33406]